MSKYTTEVRWIVEQMTYESKKNIRDRIVDACPKIFDFDFPIFDESHRITLETKILAHYFNREIGLETVGLWKLYLWEKLNNIMPGYNMIYEKLANGLDIFNNLDLWENIDGKSTMDEDAKYNATGELKGNDSETQNSTSDLTSGDTETQKTITESTGGDTETQETIGEENGTNKSVGNITVSGETKDNGTDSTSDNTISKNLTSDLPQVNYSGVDYGTELVDGTITKTGSNTIDHTQTVSNTTNNTVDDTKHSNTTTNYSMSHNSKVNSSNDYTMSHNGKINSTNDYTMNHNTTSNTTNSSTNNVNRNNIESRLRHLAGKQGMESFAELFQKYGDSVLNVDNMIIRDLKDLFMQIY